MTRGHIQKPTKALLQQLHDKQLSTFGPSSKEQKDAIVDALGGVDELLQCIWSSDIAIDEERLERLEHIIGNPHIYHHHAATNYAFSRDPPGMETFDLNNKLIKYEFVDDDMILYRLFNKRRAKKIKSILISNKTFILLVSSFVFIQSLSVLHITFGNANELTVWGLLIFIGYWLLFSIPFLMFMIGLLLCANIKALKMLSTEFVFLFKMFYLMQFVVGNTYCDSFSGKWVAIVNVNTGLQASSLLILAMITDALSIPHRIKIFFTIYAVAGFATHVVKYRRISFYKEDLYEQSNISIPNLFGFDPVHTNAVDMTGKAAQVLVIFTAKQLYTMMFKPDKAVSIRIKPSIIYQDREHMHNFWNGHELKAFKFFLIIVFSIPIIFCCIALVYNDRGYGIILIVYILFALVMAIIMLFIGSVKSSYAMNAFILSIIVAICANSLLANFERVTGVFLFIVLFGLTAIYTFELVQSHDLKKDNNASPRAYRCDEESDDDVEFSSDDQRNRDIDLDVAIGYNEESETETIEMNDIRDAGTWDNIDRQQSAQSIVDQNGDSNDEIAVDTRTHSTRL